MEWSGDVDLNDGSLEYEDYKMRLSTVDKMRLGEQSVEDINHAIDDVSSDIEFINSGN